MRRNYHEGQRPDNEHFGLSANHWLSRRPALRALCLASAKRLRRDRLRREAEALVDEWLADVVYGLPV